MNDKLRLSKAVLRIGPVCRFYISCLVIQLIYDDIPELVYRKQKSVQLA